MAAKRLIDANALLSKFKEHRDLYAPSWEAFKVSSINVKSRVDEIDTCMADVINAPAVDAVEVVHGRWLSLEEYAEKIGADAEKSEYPGAWVFCSECGQQMRNIYGWSYCPNCGAKMDGDGNG